TSVIRLAGSIFLLAFVAGCQHEAAPEVAEPNLSAPVVSNTHQATYQQSYAAPRTSQPHPYQYLTPQATYPNDWYPRTASHGWKWIVIHHSDTKVGSAASFDRFHREVRHWEMLGYHFVIGNGTGSRDGQIEVGPRWPIQKIGAHAGVK